MGKKKKEGFKVGTVASLNCGGPELSVVKVKKKTVDVFWFDQGDLRSVTLVRGTLKIVRRFTPWSGFEVGDVVSLNSGGPEMVVAKARGKVVDVVWFDHGGDLRRETLVSDTLEGPMKSAS